MRPALSVIVFTTATHAGCGLLAMLSLLSASSVVPTERWCAGIAFALSLSAMGVGLLCWFHGPDAPTRAIDVYVRWRTNWQARAVVLATASFFPAISFASGWVVYGRTDGVFRGLGLATTLLCGLTVYATAMTYATLADVEAWCNRWVVPVFLALALLTGTLWLNALVILFGRTSPDISMLLVLALFLAFYLKRKYWRHIDSTVSTVAELRSFPIPRAHAVRLRRYAFLLLFAVPLTVSLLTMGETAWFAFPASLAAALSASAGIVIERWLFFAEAEAQPH